MPTRTVFIYALLDPRTDAVRYVGQTSDLAKRLARHLSRESLRRPRHVSRWLANLVAEGLRPRVVVLEICGDDWPERERYWIALYREAGADLTNLTDGGEGSPGIHRGPLPEAVREKLAAAKRGVPLSRAHREAISRSLVGHDVSLDARRRIGAHQATRSGWRHTPEARAKIAAAQRGRRRTPAQAEKRAAAGYRHSAETRVKIAAGVTAAHARRKAAA